MKGLARSRRLVTLGNGCFLFFSIPESLTPSRLAKNCTWDKHAHLGFCEANKEVLLSAGMSPLECVQDIPVA